MSQETFEKRHSSWSGYQKQAQKHGLGMFNSFFEPCECGRDRFDHDIMLNFCPEYRLHIIEEASKGTKSAVILLKRYQQQVANGDIV